MEELTVMEITRIAAQEAAKVAIEKMEEKEKKKRKDRRDWRLRNTRLLLEHYQEFKAHAEYSLFNIKEAIEASEEDIAAYSEMIANQKDIYVKSVMLSSGRTAVLMENVDVMLSLYKLQCEHGSPEKQRRYRVIQKMYLHNSRKPAVVIASEENIDIRTIYRDIEGAIQELSTFLFGIDTFLDLS